MANPPSDPRIICVSNRLPITTVAGAPTLEFTPSSGGLVTAMGPVLRKSHGVWVGWPGELKGSAEEVEQKLAAFSTRSDFELVPVELDEKSVTGFYQGFSNQIIWPLFHDLQTKCNFDPSFWLTYQRVQDRFSQAVLKKMKTEDLIWIHDYQLMGVGPRLRHDETKNKIGFFLHIPFPGPDTFLKLPWRNDVIDSLLSYDLVGFQTRRDLQNFVACVEYLRRCRSFSRGPLFSIRNEGRECLAGSFPISIDFNEFEGIAKSPEVEIKARTIRADMNVEFLILSIDRLDYTKGIPYRIKAFQRLLEIQPALKKRVALLQVVVPSRVEVPEYKQLHAEIEQLVSQVNGAHGEPGWVPVHHLYRSLAREDVVAMYRASDVALVTPLKDGMNLVAKEYCASRINNGGALVLSEFAGAAFEFREHSFLVNPCDIEGVAQALGKAFMARKDDAREKMRGLRSLVQKSDVFSWASSFLNALGWEWQAHSNPRPATMWDRLRRNVFASGENVC